MKIDRVILALNNNKLYTPYFNIVAPIWKNIFKIKPTLIFNGTQEEFENNNFNLDGVDYLIINKEDKAAASNIREHSWSITWSLFWGAAHFKNDICLLSGIDQIPLGKFFINKIEDVAEDKFIITFSDAYLKYNKDTLGYFNTNTNIMYPSSHLIGKGEMFKKIFQINLNWKDEVQKVYSCKDKYYFSNPNTPWGLDECYASDMINQYPNQNDIIHLNIFWNYWNKNRLYLDCNKIRFTDILNIEIENYSELLLVNKNDLDCIQTIKKIADLLKDSRKDF